MKFARISAMITAACAAALLAALPGAEAQEGGAKKNYVHTLQLADRIRVSIYGEDDLTTIARIDARGRVNLPLVGEVSVGGKTIVDSQNLIEDAYINGRFLRNPQVTVNVEEYAPREVAISGAIANPGRHALPVESTYTVVELITKAGGLRDIAKGSQVRVTRTNPDGSTKVFVIDAERIIKGKKSRKDNDDDTLLLQPGDIVYVPESLI